MQRGKFFFGIVGLSFLGLFIILRSYPYLPNRDDHKHVMRHSCVWKEQNVKTLEAHHSYLFEHLFRFLPHPTFNAVWHEDFEDFWNHSIDLKQVEYVTDLM